MRRLVLGFTAGVSLLAAAVPHAQNRAAVLPIVAPRAIPPEDALIFTEQNDIDSTTGACASAGRLHRVREVSDAGVELGPSVPGLSFDIPSGVALDAAGHLYIGDRENRRVVRMDDIAGDGWVALSGAGGNVLSTPGPRPSCVNTIDGVFDVLFDNVGRLYVGVANPYRLIRVDDMNGGGWVTWTPPDAGKDSFSPLNLARDAQGRIYIADHQHDRILRINDISGSGLVSFGTHGAGVGQLNHPSGVAVDARGRIYVGDEWNHRVVRVDDMNGTGWTTYGSYGFAPGQLSQPHGVALDALGRLYIADTGNWRIVRIDDMSGAGFATFGKSELQGRALIASAVKYLTTVGNGPVMPDVSLLPLVAVGGANLTSFVAVNTGTAGNDAELALSKSTTDSSGRASVGPLSVTIDGSSGSSFTRTINPMGSARLDARATSAQTGYARLRAVANMPGIEIMQAVSGTTVTGEAAWGPAPGMAHFAIYVDNTNGARTAYTVTNPKPDDAYAPVAPGAGVGFLSVTRTLRDQSGVVIASRRDSMAPGFQIAEDVSATFAEAGPGFEGTLEISGPGGGGKIWASAVRYDNGGSSVFTALPLFLYAEDPNQQAGADPEPEFKWGPTTLYEPLIADGGGYQTDFILFNPATTATTATVEFLSANGTPLAMPINGGTQTGFVVPLAPRAVVHVLSAGSGGSTTWGSARITSPAQVRAQTILQTQNGGQITAETAVPASDPLRRFMTVVTNSSTTESGVAIGNPNGNDVTATFHLRDTSGAIAAELAVAVPAHGNIAQLVSQLFPGMTQFDGTLEIEATGGLLTAVGLRYDNPGDTVFTTTPVIRLPN